MRPTLCQIRHHPVHSTVPITTAGVREQHQRRQGTAHSHTGSEPQSQDSNSELAKCHGLFSFHHPKLYPKGTVRMTQKRQVQVPFKEVKL